MSKLIQWTVVCRIITHGGPVHCASIYKHNNNKFLLIIIIIMKFWEKKSLNFIFRVLDKEKKNQQARMWN